MGYLRFRFSNIRFKLLVLSIVLLYMCDLQFFYNGLQVSNCLIFFCLPDKEHVSPRISLTNVAELNYLLRSQIFVNNDGQL